MSTSDSTIIATHAQAHLRFDARHFGVWYNLMLSHFEAAGLADVVLEPIAPTPEGVATLLGNNKGGAEARAAQKQGDGPSAVQGEEEPAVPDVSAAAVFENFNK
jgi:hypothetical protein